MGQASMVSPVEEVVAFFSHGPSREAIAAFRLSSAAQDRLRELLHKNAAGELTQEENRMLDEMLFLDNIVSLIRARVQLASHS